MGLVWKYRQGRTWYLKYNNVLGIRPKCLHTNLRSEAELIRSKEESNLVLAQAGIQSHPLRRIHFSDFAKQFLAYKTGQGISPATIVSYTCAFNNLGDFLQADEWLNKITRTKFEEYVAHRFAQGRSKKTVRNELINFICAFRWAKREGYVLQNPLEGFQLPARIRRPPSYLQYDEYLRLKKGCDSQFGAIIDFYVLTGCRRNEGLAIRIDRDIDLQARALSIIQEKTKDFRRIPISDELLPVIKRLVKFANGSNALISYLDPVRNRVTVYSHDALSRRFARLCDKLKMRPEIHFHSLRHTFGTWLAASGASQRSIQDAIGHRDAASTKIYVHSMDSALRADLGRLSLPKPKSRKPKK